MLYALEKYNKNEAPLVVYHVYGDGSKIDSEIMDNMLKFLTLLDGQVWVIANYENNIVKEAQVKFNYFVKEVQENEKLNNIDKEAQVDLNTPVKETQLKLDALVNESKENEKLNTLVKEAQEKKDSNKSKRNNLSFFYLIESKEVNYFTCIFTLLFYFCNAFIYIEQKKYRKRFFKTCFQV